MVIKIFIESCYHKKYRTFRGHRKTLEVTIEIRIKEISSKHSFIQMAENEWKIQMLAVYVS